MRARVGLVFQNPDDQLFSPTVYEDVAFGPLYQGLPQDEVRARVLAEVAGAHRPVITGLVFAMLSGALMTAADLETYVTSPVWWGKMGAVALLLANGAWLRSIEHTALRKPTVAPTAWAKFTLSSRLSLTLWFVVVLIGVMLGNI